jgi:hypothetical protein
MSGIREILLRQKEATDAKIKALAETMEVCRKAWMESVSALEAAQMEAKKIALVLKTLDEEAAKSAQPTIMQAVLEVLRHKPNGMTALEILDEINARYFGGGIARTSLSPQLSRLKDRDKKITLRDNRWYLLPEQPQQPSLFRRI